MFLRKLFCYYGLIPYPAEKDDNDDPLPPGVGDGDGAGVRNGVAVFIGDGAGDFSRATFCGIYLAFIVNTGDGRIRGGISYRVVRSLVGGDGRVESGGHLVIHRDIVNRNGGYNGGELRNGFRSDRLAANGAIKGFLALGILGCRLCHPPFALGVIRKILVVGNIAVTAVRAGVGREAD